MKNGQFNQQVLDYILVMFYIFHIYTFVCFGDCINTASKLGQDMADELEILISPEVYQLVKQKKLEKYKQLNRMIMKYVATEKDIKGQKVT